MGSETSTDGADAYAVYRAAVARTYGVIDPTPDLTGGLDAIHARARAKQARLGRLLAAMGDPHLAAPVVHVGGTSGKGSTSVAVAAILSAAGYRTLLHTSPYLQVATEKLQLDGRLVDPATFAAGIATVLGAAEALGEGPIGYPELWMALIGWTMRALGVDAAVIEVGAGGLLDMTNVVRPTVSVITSVGLDHTETLGATVAEIALQKAGIIKPGIPVVTAVTNPTALAVIRAEAAHRDAPLTEIGLGDDVVVDDDRGDWLAPVGWRDVASGQRYVGGMAGRIQAVNGATALATVRALRGQGWVIGDDAVQSGLAAGRLPGRLEIVRQHPTVVLDAAHNPQKAAALAGDLATMGRRCVGVIGVLAAKQAREVLAELAPALRALVATEPMVLGKPSLPAAELAAIALEVGIDEVVAEADPGRALDRALEMAGRDEVVLVTGSLYLIGELRRRWYPDEAMIAQGTAWPVASSLTPGPSSRGRGGL